MALDYISRHTFSTFYGDNKKVFFKSAFLEGVHLKQ